MYAIRSYYGSVLETARRYFPSAALHDPHDEAVPIEAIYTIGSLGTIAQSEDSDIDYWLCCKLDELVITSYSIHYTKLYEG